MIDDLDSGGDDAAADGGPSVRRRRLLAGAGALAFGAAVPGVGAASDGSDPPHVAWQRRYDFTDYYFGDEVRTLAPVADGGSLAGGSVVAKLGVCGRVAWEREYPPVGPVTAATTVGDSRAAGDGSLVAGEGYGIGPDDTYPGYALRLDRSGNEVWRVQFTPEFYGASFQPRAVVPAANGGHVVLGALKQLNAEFFHGWAAEVTADGEVVWSRLVESGFAPSSPRSGFSDAVRVDDGYLAAGFAPVGFSDGEADLRPWLVRLDADGDPTWTRTYRDADGAATALIESPDGRGHVLAGYSDDDAFLLGVDADGDVRWSERYGGDSGSDRFEAVVAADGGYVAAGTTDTPSLGRRGWVVGTDETGGVEWTWRADERDTGVRALLAADGGYEFAGGVGADAWVGRLEADAE